jgi:hypothetical protein
MIDREPSKPAANAMRKSEKVVLGNLAARLRPPCSRAGTEPGLPEEQASGEPRLRLCLDFECEPFA